jgi:ABC-type spermidine/putrescine transport system permease subunit II
MAARAEHPARHGRSAARAGRAGGAGERDPLRTPLLSLPAVLFVAVAFLLPLAVLVVYSLWTTVDGEIVRDWTLDNYRRFLQEGTYSRTLLDTFWFAGLASLITVVLTFPFAYFVALKVRPSRRLLWILVAILPFWTSYLIRVFAWRNMFGDTGILNDALLRIGLISEPLTAFGLNRTAIVITFVYLLFPLAFLATYITLERMDPMLLEAGSDLGASARKRMQRIVLPMARSGLAAGFVLSFITMVGDYVTPSLIGGTSGTFYSNLVVNQFGNSLQWGFGASLGLILLVSVLLLLLVLRRATGAVETAGEYTKRYVPSRAPFLRAYALLFVAFLYLPIAVLVLFSFNDADYVGFPFQGATTYWFGAVFDDASLVDAFWTSIRVAAASVALSVTLGTAAAVQLARTRGRLRNLSLSTIAAPLLLPPVVLGIAIIIGLNALDVQRGLWTIVLGHSILTLPVVMLLVLSRLEGLDRNQELAAMDLGATPLKTFLRVSLPQAAPGVVAAAMIALALSMDEFIMTFLVTGADTTLPLYIFGSIRFQVTPVLTALSSLMVAASFLLMILGALIAFGRGRWNRTVGTAS